MCPWRADYNSCACTTRVLDATAANGNATYLIEPPHHIDGGAIAVHSTHVTETKSIYSKRLKTCAAAAVDEARKELARGDIAWRLVTLAAAIPSIENDTGDADESDGCNRLMRDDDDNYDDAAMSLSDVEDPSTNTVTTRAVSDVTVTTDVASPRALGGSTPSLVDVLPFDAVIGAAVADAPDADADADADAIEHDGFLGTAAVTSPEPILLAKDLSPACIGGGGEDEVTATGGVDDISTAAVSRVDVSALEAEFKTCQGVFIGGNVAAEQVQRDINQIGHSGDRAASFSPRITRSGKRGHEGEPVANAEVLSQSTRPRRYKVAVVRFNPVAVVVVDTYVDSPCVRCAKVDDIQGLVCERCDKLTHLHCMTPVVLNVPSARWFCDDCVGVDGGARNKKNDLIETACLLCGVQDDDDGPVCDRCNAVFHRACLGDAPWNRFASCETNAERWFCDMCAHDARDDDALRVLADRAFSGVQIVKVADDSMLTEASAADIAEDQPSSPSERLKLPSQTAPCLFSWTTRGERRARLSIFIPGCEADAYVYEVVHVSETPLFKDSSLLATSQIYLLTGERHPIPIPASLNHDVFPPVITHVGHVRGWVVPNGFGALVPMRIDVRTMELLSVPRDMQCNPLAEVMEKHGVKLSGLELYLGAGGWLDGGFLSGKMQRGLGVESDEAVAAFTTKYASKYADVYLTRVETLLGEDTHYCAPGSPASEVLERIKLFGTLDCLFGSPLCEGFTNLNDRPDSDNSEFKRRHIQYFGQAFLKFMPTYGVLENVPELAFGAYALHLFSLITLLAMNGYQLQAFTLTASAFGAASARERFILVATRDGTPPPPPPQQTHACDNGLRWALAPGKPPVSVDASRRLKPIVTAGQCFKKLGAAAEPRKASEIGSLHAPRTETEGMQCLLNALPVTPNACYADIPKAARKKNPVDRAEGDAGAGIARVIYCRVKADKPAPSFTKQFRPDGYMGRVIHPTQARVVTPAEALVCASFDFKRFPEASLKTGYVLAGNAFSPLAAKAVILSLASPWSSRRPMTLDRV